MKLYFSPGACSLAPHIILYETGLPFALERVDTRARLTATGADYLDINPNGYVPALELDDGQVITEVPVILQYLGDRVPDRALVPDPASAERYRLQEWLNFIASEIHKGFGPLFADDTPIHYRPAVKEKLRRRFDHVGRRLSQAPYLMGPNFSVADAHLWVMANWARSVGIDWDAWPTLTAYMARVRSRPSVLAAIDAESLDW